MVIYCDAADIGSFLKYAQDPRIAGFTSNPTLMRKACVENYEAFARNVIQTIDGKDISFEVLADDWRTMERQARTICGWGENVWAKIPITNTKGESCLPLVRDLSELHLNVTAVMTQAQIDKVGPYLQPWHILSVFMGRMADTGRRTQIVMDAKRPYKLLWASTRQVFSVYEAHEQGFDIITLTPDLIEKLKLKGKDLAQYSLETVKMFHEDGKGFTL